MSERNVTLFCLVAAFLLMTTGAMAINGFDRVAEIPVPEANLNNGGTGNMISGVDVDGDGMTEIYLVNDNWGDGPTEVIPRIYKMEYDGTDWNVVWSAVVPSTLVEKQNTWPPLSLADLDNDGKMELVWGVINWATTAVPNPSRIVVYEHAGGDVFGVADGSGGYNPNSTWTITTLDNDNVRPMDWEILDIDSDGTIEIVFAERAGTTGGHYFGVCSVDDIPDNGDGSETWTLEVSGKDFTLPTTNVGITNKWDVAVVGTNAYFFCELEISKLSWNGTAWDWTSLSPMLGGSSVQSAQAVDLDEDGVEEIICAVYDWGDDSKKAVMLLQEDGDTLKHTELLNVSAYWSSGSRGAWGGAIGDIDQDGYLDFVFGSRAGDVNARIFKFSYLGGDITDPMNYGLAVIDEKYGSDGVWSVVNIANMDDDPELEVVYTSSTPMGGLMSATAPIIVLDYNGYVGEPDDIVVADEVLLNGATPEGLGFKPGRILDENVIWFAGNGGSSVGTYIFRSVDGGKTFTHNATAIPGRVAQMDAFDENTALVAVAEGKIYRTTDGGQIFTEVYSYTISILAPGWFDGLRVLNANVAVAFGDMEPNGNMHFVRTEDQGANWTEITGIDYLNSAYGYYTWGLASCNIGESIWCAGLTSEYDSGYVFRSYDAGLTWESFAIPDTIIQKYPRAITFVDDDHGMIADRYGAVIMSNDGGATWYQGTQPDTASALWVNGVVTVPGTDVIIALSDNGVYYTSDLGATWKKMVTPSVTDDDYYTSAVFLNKDFGYFFTDEGKVLRFEGQLVSGIVDSDTKVLDKYKLHQNFPNPFNPTTTIAFEIPVSKHVRLIIYDMLGREVISLVDNELQPGRHSAIWNGKNKYGHNVSTGIYIYQLRTENITKSKTMTFVK